MFKYLQNTFTPKPYQLENWNFERKFTSLHMSQVNCHMARVTCHVSHVTYHVSHITCPILFSFFSLFFSYKVVKLGGWGSLSTGPTPSSFFVFVSFPLKHYIGSSIFGIIVHTFFLFMVLHILNLFLVFLLMPLNLLIKSLWVFM